MDFNTRAGYLALYTPALEALLFDMFEDMEQDDGGYPFEECLSVMTEISEDALRNVRKALVQDNKEREKTL